MRHQDLNFVLTWNLFLFHIQVGCYFQADALRLIHVKSTHCLELSRGEKRNNNKKAWREKWGAHVIFDPEMESLSVSVSKPWQRILLFAGWASFSGVIFPWMLRVFLRWAQEANHKQREDGKAYSQPPCSFHWRGLSQPLLLGCENKPDGCAISVFCPLAVSGTKQGQQSFFKTCLERERKSLDGTLIKMIGYALSWIKISYLKNI